MHSNVTIIVDHFLRRGKYVVFMIKLQNNCVILLDEIAKYMETVKLLDYVEKPLYQKLRDILLQGLKAIGSKDDGKLDLTVVENGSLKAKPVAKVSFVIKFSFGFPVTVCNK